MQLAVTNKLLSNAKAQIVVIFVFWYGICLEHIGGGIVRYSCNPKSLSLEELEMKIVIAFLLIFQISNSTTSYVQTSSEGRGVKVRLPVLKPVVNEGGVSVPDGGFVWNSQFARQTIVKLSPRFPASPRFVTVLSRSLANREIELNQDQVDAMNSLERASRHEASLIEKQKNESDKQALIREHTEKFDRDVMEVLLPHQRELLKKLLFRESIQEKLFRRLDERHSIERTETY